MIDTSNIKKLIIGGYSLLVYEMFRKYFKTDSELFYFLMVHVLSDASLFNEHVRILNDKREIQTIQLIDVSYPVADRSYNQMLMKSTLTTEYHGQNKVSTLGWYEFSKTTLNRVYYNTAKIIWGKELDTKRLLVEFQNNYRKWQIFTK